MHVRIYIYVCVTGSEKEIHGGETVSVVLTTVDLWCLLPQGFGKEDETKKVPVCTYSLTLSRHHVT